jgi:hypothetical protein
MASSACRTHEIWPQVPRERTFAGMRMGNRDRRSASEISACVVCGSTDGRSLSFTRLLEGERVTVCGSHKVAHRRSETIARTVEELRTLVGERRKLSA